MSARTPFNQAQCRAPLYYMFVLHDANLVNSELTITQFYVKPKTPHEAVQTLFEMIGENTWVRILGRVSGVLPLCAPIHADS